MLFSLVATDLLVICILTVMNSCRTASLGDVFAQICLNFSSLYHNIHNWI